MRREALAVVALMLMASVTVLAAPTPLPGPVVARAPIAILSDADFTAANGVVAGLGTPANPYVISGWHITSASTAAITIRNTSAAFVVRDNQIDGSLGVSFSAATSVAVFANNHFLVKGTGIHLNGANATIRDNSFVRAEPGPITVGVSLSRSSALVEANNFAVISTAIIVDKGSPVLRGNDIHHATVGIRVQASTAVQVQANVVTTCANAGIYLYDSITVNASFNTVTTCHTGIEVWSNKDVDVRNNTVEYSMGVGVTFESTSGNFTGNVVVDGADDAVTIWHSPMLFANNTIHNNLGIGFHSMMSDARVEGNLVTMNGVGVHMADDIQRLRFNVLANNTVGISIPYAARQAIPYLHGNLVNGVNVDGALVASEQVFFYHAANVTITGVRDSGFGAGYYGSLTAQGGVVLYDVDTATIDAALISHHRVGVGVVNSFNVVVSNSLLASNAIGVSAEAAAAVGIVPPCVVSVKDSNVTIPVDPPATVGIDVKGCYANVLRVNVSVVDVGIRLDAQASGVLLNNTVYGTRIGLDVVGKPGEVNVTGNLVVDNRIGARFQGTQAVLVENRFESNDGAGIRLEAGASLTLWGNRVVANGEGIVDTRACLGSGTCATLTAAGNVITQNQGVGARINGTTSFQGDVVSDNGGAGLVLGTTTTIRAVIANGNGADGLEARGQFAIRESSFIGNDGNGARLVGSGDIRGSNFSHNAAAGLRMTATYVTAFDLNISYNFDGILFDELAPTAPTIPAFPSISLAGILQAGPVVSYQQDPMDIHRSKLIGNERDAIRAGAAIVNATHNYFGAPTGPALSVGDQVGAYRNGITPTVRFVPWYEDEAMTTTSPIFLL